MKNNHPEMFKYFPLCYICIPDILLYNRLSFENGFYNEPITGYSSTEVNYHFDNLYNILKAESWKNSK